MAATLDEVHHATCSTDDTAGRGHGVFCNLLVIRYHFKHGVETQPFFWPRFHASFCNSLKINVSKNKAWPRPASASKRNSEGASGGRGVTLETLTDGQMSGKSGTKTENGHISTATAEVEPLEAWTPGPRWKGPAEQSL